jgi:hypothetical protein
MRPARVSASPDSDSDGPVRSLPFEWAHESGGGAGLLGDEVRSDGALGLAQVVHRHGPGPSSEHGGNALLHVGVGLELDTHDLRDGFSGEVVLGRPEPTAADHGVATVEGQ